MNGYIRKKIGETKDRLVPKMKVEGQATCLNRSIPAASAERHVSLHLVQVQGSKKQKKNSSETSEGTHTNVNVLSLTQCTPVISMLHVDPKGTIETRLSSYRKYLPKYRIY